MGSPLFAKKKKHSGRSVHHTVRHVDHTAHDTLGIPMNIADSLVFEATMHLGKPYIRGCKGPNGFDCSGFTGYVYSRFGFTLGASSSDQWLQGVRIATENVHKGDLVFFTGRNARGGIGHVGMVVDVDPKNHSFKFIHAASSGISIDRYPDAYYYSRRYKGLRRIVSYDDDPQRLTPDTFAYDFNVRPASLSSSQPANNRLIMNESTGKQIHIVKAGETVYSIAQKYGLGTGELRRWNHLSTKSQIRAGQKLIVGLQKDPQEYLKEADEQINTHENDLVITVKEGQTIYDISQNYNCTVKQLREWNHINGTQLTAGQSLRIRPKNAKNIPDVMKGDYIVHTTAQGENLYSLAAHYNCTTKEIKEWNNLDENKLSIGQQIKIKDKKATQAHAAAVAATPDNGITHTVRNGETLKSIAASFNCTVDDLIKWNHLRNKNIRPGRILKVQKGNSKVDEYIALRTFTDTEDDALPSESDNQNETENTTIYNIINESTPQEVVALAQPNAEIAQANANEQVYTIKGGDNLRLIGKKFGCTSGDIIRWNNLKSYRLRPGQKLIIKTKGKKSSLLADNTKQASSTQTQNNQTTPQEQTTTSTDNTTKSVNEIVYTVKKGDNLHQIATKYKVTPESIRKWNGMKNSNLSIGQKLKIKTTVAVESSTANSSTASTATTAQDSTKTQNVTTNAEQERHVVNYTVKEKDTVYKIGLKFGVSSAQIMRWNNMTSRALRKGQVLIIKTKKNIQE